MRAHAARYALAWVALVVLAILSWACSRLALAGWAVPVALLISFFKATLIGLVFMRLSTSSVSVRLVLVVAAAMTALLVGLSATDILTRDPEDSLTRRAP